VAVLLLSLSLKDSLGPPYARVPQVPDLMYSKYIIQAVFMVLCDYLSIPTEISMTDP
jgi:hypothetical protein